jgi:O-antigen/teichoic acid export membrane protein
MFRAISTNKIWATSSNHGSKYLLGLKFPTASGLVWGHVIGAVAPVLTLLGKREIYTQLGAMRRNKMPLMPLMRKYKEFPLINAPHAFYDEANRAVLFLVISAFFGEITLGLFAITMRYLKVPVQVFGASLSQVFMPTLAKDFSEKREIRTRIKRIMIGNALVGILPFTVLFFFGHEIFSFFFGSAWAEAGTYAEIISPWLYLNFITSPVSMLPTIVRCQRTFFIIVLVATLLALAIVGTLAYVNQPFVHVLVALSAVMAAMDIFLIFWFLKIARRTATDKMN